MNQAQRALGPIVSFYKSERSSAVQMLREIAAGKHRWTEEEKNCFEISFAKDAAEEERLWLLEEVRHQSGVKAAAEFHLVCLGVGLYDMVMRDVARRADRSAYTKVVELFKETEFACSPRWIKRKKGELRKFRQFLRLLKQAKRSK